jgi:hypothetical protein
MMFESAGVKRDGAVRFREEMRGSLDRVGRHARALRHAPWIVGGGGRRDRLKASRVFIDEVAVLEPIPQHDVQEAHQQYEIRARPHRQVEIRVARDGRHPRIDDDELAAAIATSPDVARRDRRAFPDVRADDEEDVGLGNLAPRNRTAVDAEGGLVRRASRDHTEPAVVVDVAGAQGHACELPHQVGLFGRERGPAIHGDRVLAVPFLDLTKPPGRESQGLVPSRRAKSRVGPQQWIEEAIWVAALQISLHALRAQHALVERELLPRFEPNHLVVPDFELNATLLPTEAAVRLHQPVGGVLALIVPAALRRGLRVRAELVGEALHTLGGLSHELVGSTGPSASTAPLTESCACRPDTGSAT